jgi:hypothetical protein
MNIVAQALGRRAKGVKKTLTPEQREAKRQLMKKINQQRMKK